jgi:hypothetical protein
MLGDVAQKLVSGFASVQLENAFQGRESHTRVHLCQLPPIAPLLPRASMTIYKGISSSSILRQQRHAIHLDIRRQSH